jgi:hypothetical protein
MVEENDLSGLDFVVEMMTTPSKEQLQTRVLILEAENRALKAQIGELKSHINWGSNHE